MLKSVNTTVGELRQLNPSFFIVGAAKAGTTALAQALSEHPQIFIPPEKEMMLFHRQVSEIRLREYEEKYRTSKEATLSGDASPQYGFGTKHPFTAKRIQEYNPDSRIVFLVRDPIARFQSHILQLNSCGVYFPTIEEVIEHHPETIDAGRYSERLNDYQRFFPKANIHVISFEDLVKEPEKNLTNACKFLGLEQEEVFLPRSNRAADHFEDRTWTRTFRRLGAGKMALCLPTQMRQQLIRLFKQPQKSYPSLSRSEHETLKEIFAVEKSSLKADWNIDTSSWDFTQKLTF